MHPDLLAEARGIAALLALLLLPGLAIVRSPWMFVPLLSAAFWVTSLWWLPAGSGREAFLHAAVAALALLASLRMLKPLGARRPSWPVLVLLVSVLLRLVAFFLWPLPPNPGAEASAAETLLVAWHDGAPRSYQPLASIPHFGAHDPGVAALAADVALISGLPAHRALQLVIMTAEGLAALGLYAVLLGRFASRAAALAAAASVWLLPLSRLAPGTSLALACAFAGGALLVPRTSRSSAVAGGLLLAAALQARPSLLLVSCVPVLIALARQRQRGGIAAATAVLIAAPWLPRVWLAPPAPWDIAAGLALIGLGYALAGLVERSRGPAVPVALAVVVAAAGIAWVHGSGPRVEPEELEALVWVRDQAPGLDVICAAPGGSGRWIPGLARRAVAPALDIPPYPAGPADRPCHYVYALAPDAREGPAAFRNGLVTILKNP